MENFNKNNPTLGWTEDEQYDFAKMENKWLKELTSSTCNGGKRATGVGRLATEQTFASVEEINISFKSDILQRKETWKHLCHICDYGTNAKSYLTSHLTVHGIGDRFKCDQCDRNYSNKNNLKRHIKEHSSCRQTCTQCGKMFNTPNNLKQHITNVHSEKRFKCEQCEKIFSTIASLNAHKNAVHVLKTFKCDQCKYRSKRNSDLKKHINLVHNGVFCKCDLCDFQGSSSDLKKHKESIHENKKNWFCKACPYSTYHKRSFLQHMRVHTGEKPYQCKTCRKCFAQASKANRHCKNTVNFQKNYTLNYSIK